MLNVHSFLLYSTYKPIAIITEPSQLPYSQAPPHLFSYSAAAKQNGEDQTCMGMRQSQSPILRQLQLYVVSVVREANRMVAVTIKKINLSNRNDEIWMD